MTTIRPVTNADHQAVLDIVAPVFAAGETYALDRDMSLQQVADFWFMPRHQVFVATEADRLTGSFYLMANQGGGGAHVANCGFVTAADSQGKGVARAMCEYAMKEATRQGFRAMQFNHVVSTNDRAVRLWKSLGFEIVGTLPQAFNHPRLGFVDSYVMFRKLL
nr:N-acetyltransferase [Devosia pacifica]